MYVYVNIFILCKLYYYMETGKETRSWLKKKRSALYRMTITSTEHFSLCVYLLQQVKRQKLHVFT